MLVHAAGCSICTCARTQAFLGRLLFFLGVTWFLAGDDRMLPEKGLHGNGRSLGKY